MTKQEIISPGDFPLILPQYSSLFRDNISSIDRRSAREFYEILYPSG